MVAGASVADQTTTAFTARLRPPTRAAPPRPTKETERAREAQPDRAGHVVVPRTPTPVGSHGLRGHALAPG